MELPVAIADVLERDRALAAQHGVDFSVVSRPADANSPLDGPPDRHGTFEDPADAVALGLSLRGRAVTVLADGSGPYWHTGASGTVDSRLLEIVCGDKRLGPEEADREHQRERLRYEIERLRADQRLAKAVEVVRGCRDESEARIRLETGRLSMSADQARHLLSNRSLHLLTHQGRLEIEGKLKETLQELDELSSD